MRNFRRLVLGLVLVSLAGVSWGETWRCETRWGIKETGMAVHKGGQKVDVVLFLSDPDPVIEVWGKTRLAYSIQVERNNDVIARGYIKQGRGFAPGAGNTWRLLKKRGRLEMDVLNANWTVDSQRYQRITINGDCV
jgi:hypothetical protein